MTKPLERFVQRTCIGCFKAKVDVRIGVPACGDALRCEKCKSTRSRAPVLDKQARADRESTAEGFYPSFVPFTPKP